jgi:hypothetical protein
MTLCLVCLCVLLWHWVDSHGSSKLAKPGNFLYDVDAQVPLQLTQQQ